MRFLLPYITILLLSLNLRAQTISYKLEPDSLDQRLYAQLNSVIMSRSDTTAIRADFNRLLFAKGYLNASITFNQDDLSLRVVPGCDFRFGLIALNTDTGEGGFNPLSYLGTRFTEVKLSELSEEIRRFYLDQAYAEVQVQIGDIQVLEDRCLVNLRFEINEGEQWVVKEIEFSPLNRVGSVFLRRVIGFRDSLFITRDNLNRIREDLLLTGYFEQVNEPLLLRQDSLKKLYIPVQERNANYLDGIIGYVPSNQGGGSFIGEGKIGLVNAIADGNTLDLLYQRLTLDNTRLNVDVQQQWLGGLPIGIRGGFTLFQQDTNYQSRIFTIGAEYYLTPRATLYADYQATGVTASESVQLNRTEVDGSRAITTIGFRYRNLNHPRVPTHGYHFDLSFGTGIKRVEADDGITLNSSRERTRQQILNAEIQTYHPINLPHLIHFSGMLHLTTAQYFTEIDLMRFGGARSFRGFTEEQFFASRAGWFNSEYRYLLDRESFLFVFNTVGGYYRPQLLTELNQQFEQADFLYSFGFGLSYNTRAGQIMFSYAISPQDELANGKIHFGILTRL